MGTIRDNILFGMAYDSAWYDKVIEACSLDEVIQLKLKRMVSVLFTFCAGFQAASIWGLNSGGGKGSDSEWRAEG